MLRGSTLQRLCNQTSGTGMAQLRRGHQITIARTASVDRRRVGSWSVMRNNNAIKTSLRSLPLNSRVCTAMHHQIPLCGQFSRRGGHFGREYSQASSAAGQKFSYEVNETNFKDKVLEASDTAIVLLDCYAEYVFLNHTPHREQNRGSGHTRLQGSVSFSITHSICISVSPQLVCSLQEADSFVGGRCGQGQWQAHSCQAKH